MIPTARNSPRLSLSFYNSISKKGKRKYVTVRFNLKHLIKIIIISCFQYLLSYFQHHILYNAREILTMSLWNFLSSLLLLHVQGSAEKLIGWPWYFHGEWYHVIFFIYKFISKHSLLCSPCTSSIGVAVLGSHGKKVIKSRHDVIIWTLSLWTFQPSFIYFWRIVSGKIMILLYFDQNDGWIWKWWQDMKYPSKTVYFLYLTEEKCYRTRKWCSRCKHVS